MMNNENYAHNSEGTCYSESTERQSDTSAPTIVDNFVREWLNRGYEKGEAQSFWLDLLRTVYNVDEPEQIIRFEERVKLDKTAFIDGYIESTHTLIEQKSLGKNLRKPILQSDGTFLTPFQQAKRYSANLPYSKRPRWIITCNFEEFLIYDMEYPTLEPYSIFLRDLADEYVRMTFLVNPDYEPDWFFRAAQLSGVPLESEAFSEVDVSGSGVRFLKDSSQLNAIHDFLPITYYVPEWGFALRLRPISKSSIKKIQDNIDPKNLNCSFEELLLILSCVDEKNQAIFSTNDITVIYSKNPAVIHRIADKICEISAISGEKIKKEEFKPSRAAVLSQAQN